MQGQEQRQGQRQIPRWDGTLTGDFELFAGEGGGDVFAGGVGLGLVSAGGGGHPVQADGAAAVVEEVVHFAGVELGSFAEPVGAVGLLGGLEVVGGSALDVVVAALGVGEAEEG